MNIKHYPITNISQAEKLYSEKDGVPVKHVCTTEFHDAIADVFYRETPHPKFGNKYFALLFRDDKLYIANADQIEDLTFGMVENDEGNLEYSQYRHDYKSFKNGNMIDGGRDYIRSSGKVKVLVVRDGMMKHYGANDESYI
jgi:glutamine cyclotransferase